MHRIHTHTNPQVEHLANLLESDPIVAAQLKEAMPPERLLELLDLPPALLRILEDPE
jgi:hypothetical protein